MLDEIRLVEFLNDEFRIEETAALSGTDPETVRQEAAEELRKVRARQGEQGTYFERRNEKPIRDGIISEIFVDGAFAGRAFDRIFEGRPHKIAYLLPRQPLAAISCLLDQGYTIQPMSTE